MGTRDGSQVIRNAETLGDVSRRRGYVGTIADKHFLMRAAPDLAGNSRRPAPGAANELSVVGFGRGSLSLCPAAERLCPFFIEIARPLDLQHHVPCDFIPWNLRFSDAFDNSASILDKLGWQQ